MQAIFTTEKIIDQICTDKSKDIWFKILQQQKKLVVSVETGDSWSSQYIANFHQSGKTIISLDFDANELPNHPDYLEALSDCLFLLDIPETDAKYVSRDYGISCFSSRTNDIPYIAEQGWQFDTTDDGIEKSWENFYRGAVRNSTSAILIDRFLFCKEWNKGNGCPDDDITDCLFNVREIIDNILPAEIDHGEFTVSIIFSIEKMTKCEKKDPTGKIVRDAQNKIVYEYYSFQEIVSFIDNEVKKQIYRPYRHNIELIGINKKCSCYNDTHDRCIITNNSTTMATQKLVAFNDAKNSLYKQIILFNYLYSVGLNGKCSTPEATKRRITDSMKQLINSSQPQEIQYAYNGVISNFQQDMIKNRLLK